MTRITNIQDEWTMKIGILSLYGNYNFGNRLQNYALQMILERYGRPVCSIKNECYHGSTFEWIKKKFSVNEWRWLQCLRGNKKTSEIIRFTRQRIHTTRKMHWCNREEKQSENLKTYDMYCAGSDQIWNPYCKRTGLFNYLGFAERERTFSYAASFGVDSIPEEYMEAVRKGLNHIKYISVREDAGKRIVEELTGRTDVQVLVDPTMLLTPAEWDKVAEKPKAKLPEKYLLTYFLGDVSERRRASIEAKAKALGCETVWLMDKKSPFYAIGPGHFVYLIKHAQMVCTDSFHGSVFSFLYGRPLAVYDRKGSTENMSSRLETLAAKFDLHGQMVRDEHLEEVPTAVEYSRGYLALEEERKKSKAFLDMVFEEAERAGLCK